MRRLWTLSAPIFMLHFYVMSLSQLVVTNSGVLFDANENSNRLMCCAA
jgi:hypothetical protein